MTLEEQKLAVCKKLPELVRCGEFVPYGGDDSFQVSYFFWKPPFVNEERRISWPTEGLQVCHEAEKKLCGIYYAPSLWQKYEYTLHHVARGHGIAGFCATYEQRLEALTRVWFPERF